MPGTPLENISLKNITVQYAGGGKAEYADRDYHEQGTNYPEPKFAGFTPSYGVFARHVRGLKLTNLNFSVEKLEGRPMLKFIDVENVEVKNVNGPNK